MEVTAIPLSAVESTSPRTPESSMSLTSVADEVVSSLVDVIPIVPVNPKVGASLTAVTVIDAISVAVLKAVVVPLVDESTLVPNVPVD